MFFIATTKRYRATLGLIACVAPAHSLRKALIFCSVLDIAAALLVAVIPFIVAAAFEGVIEGTAARAESHQRAPCIGLLETASVPELCAIALGLICASAVARACSDRFITSVTIRARLKLREAAFDVVAATPLDGSPIPTPGEAVSIIRSDVNAAAGFLQSTLHPLVSTFVQCSAIFSLVAWYRPLALPFVLAFVPIITISQWSWERGVVPLFDTIRDHRMRADKAISSLVGGIRIARALNRVSAERMRWFSEEQQIEDLESRAVTINRRISMMWDIALPAASIWVIWWSGARSDTSAADVVLVLTCLGLLLSPLQQFFQLLRTGAGALASAERLIEFLGRRTVGSSQDALQVVDSYPAPGLFAESIEFHYVGNESFALGPLSLSVRVGECVALVGASGSGKSTLGWMLAGVLPPTSGAVCLQPPSGTMDCTTTAAAVVDQEAYLFEGTVASNIRFGNPRATDEEIELAARVAGLDEILSSGVGLAMNVGHAGVGVSGGQRCRIALARALLMRPLVLVIDEFSSQLHSELEFLIATRLRESSKDRCTVFITHRPEVMAVCDRAYVLSAGKLARCAAAASAVKRVEGEINRQPDSEIRRSRST